MLTKQETRETNFIAHKKHVHNYATSQRTQRRNLTTCIGE